MFLKIDVFYKTWKKHKKYTSFSRAQVLLKIDKKIDEKIDAKMLRKIQNLSLANLMLLVYDQFLLPIVVDSWDRFGSTFAPSFLINF